MPNLDDRRFKPLDDLKGLKDISGLNNLNKNNKISKKTLANLNKSEKEKSRISPLSNLSLGNGNDKKKKKKRKEEEVKVNSSEYISSEGQDSNLDNSVESNRNKIYNNNGEIYDIAKNNKNNSSNYSSNKNSPEENNKNVSNNLEKEVKKVDSDIRKDLKFIMNNNNNNNNDNNNNNNSIKPAANNTPSNKLSSLNRLDGSIGNIEDNLKDKTDKYKYSVVLKLDLDYNNFNKEELSEIIRDTYGGTVINLVDIDTIEPSLEFSPGSVIVKVNNLSYKDYSTLLRFKPRVEEHITNKYLDKKENIKPEVKEPEKFEDIKYYDNKEGDLKFYNGDGRKINIIKIDNRVVNINRISKTTQIMYTKLLSPIPKKKVIPEKEEDESFTNKVKRTTVNTLDKIKSSFTDLVSSKKEEVEEHKPLPKKRTIKNNYTFHQIPRRKMKNSSKKPPEIKTEIRKSKVKSIIEKKHKKKVNKRAKKLKRVLINNHGFHKLRKK